MFADQNMVFVVLCLDTSLVGGCVFGGGCLFVSVLVGNSQAVA